MVYFLLVPVLVLSLFYGSIVDERPMLREAKTGNWIGSFIGHEVGSLFLLNIGCRLVSQGEQRSYLRSNSECWFYGQALGCNEWFSYPHVSPEAYCESCCYKLWFLSHRFWREIKGSKYLLHFVLWAHFYLPVRWRGSVHSVLSFTFEVFSHGVCGVVWKDCVFDLFVFWSSLLDASSPVPELRSVQLTDIILDVSLSGDIIAIASCHGVRFLSWELEMMNKKDYPFHINCRHFWTHWHVACDLNQSHTRYLVSDMNIIYEVDFQSHNILACYHGHHGTVHSLRYCSECDSFISGSDDSSIRLWMVDRN